MDKSRRFKHKVFLGFFLSTYVIILYFNPYFRYYAYHFWGAIGAYAMGGRSPILTALQSMLCSGLMIGIIYGYTLDKKYLVFVTMIFGGLYITGIVLFVIEKFVSESLIPDQINSTIELLTIQPTLLVILLGSYQFFKAKHKEVCYESSDRF